MDNLLVRTSRENNSETHYIFNDDGKIVGSIKGKTFIKHARASTHMLRQPRGWASDKSIIKEIEGYQVQKIKIIDDETGIIFYTSLSNFIDHSFKLNRGHGQQMCLPLKYWQIKDKNQVTQPSLPYGGNNA